MLLSNQASLGLSPEQTLLQSNSYQAQIAKLEGLISVKSTEIARDENLRESFEIERSALSDASRLMQAIDQYESGEMPTDNHVLAIDNRSEEHTSELQSLMRIWYAVFCVKIKKKSRSVQKMGRV